MFLLVASNDAIPYFLNNKKNSLNIGPTPSFTTAKQSKQALWWMTFFVSMARFLMRIVND